MKFCLRKLICGLFSRVKKIRKSTFQINVGRTYFFTRMFVSVRKKIFSSGSFSTSVEKLHIPSIKSFRFLSIMLKGIFFLWPSLFHFRNIFLHRKLETFFSPKCNFMTVVWKQYNNKKIKILPWHRETYGSAVIKLPKHPPEIFYSRPQIFIKYLALF